MLLLPAAVRHRVPDAEISCWFIESDPSERYNILDVPLGSTYCCCVAFIASIRLHIVGSYGHARSQGGRQPAAAKPTL